MYVSAKALTFLYRMCSLCVYVYVFSVCVCAKALTFQNFRQGAWRDLYVHVHIHVHVDLQNFYVCVC
jgi:hypothetical protein